MKGYQYLRMLLKAATLKIVQGVKKCLLLPESENLLRLAAEKFDFSARSYFRLIKTARTIADLEGSNNILPAHMAEALQYRQMI